MSNGSTYSLEQVLESIHEMRESLRETTQKHSHCAWDKEMPFWEEAELEIENWFEDCEFDPREKKE